MDGVAFTDTATTTETGDTVALAQLSPGEEWQCTVTPNDGDDDGDAAAATVTIENCFAGWDDTTVNVFDDADYQFVGNAYHGYLGEAVALADDLDGDGRPDVVIGEPGNNRVYIFLAKNLNGGEDYFASEADYIIRGPASWDGTEIAIGASIDVDGDFDGDGLNDLLLGDPDHDYDTGGRVGRVWVLMGASLGTRKNIYLDDSADYTFEGAGAGNR